MLYTVHCTLDRMPCPTDTIIKGDAKSVVIAAASIVAKVTRDRLMIAFDKQYPAYGFAQHKGYPVPDHMRAVYSVRSFDSKSAGRGALH